MNKQVEKEKYIKEIADIIVERDKAIQLLNENNEIELSAHLEKLQQKYPMETFFYNLGKPNPPKSVYENARNCIPFLNELLAAKTVESLMKKE